MEEDPLSWRLLKRDGTFNIERKESRGEIRADLYHWFLTLPWRGLFGAVLLAYVLVNLVFALLYVACGPDALSGGSFSEATQPFLNRFEDAYFFSVQTIATIGYGRLVPNGLLPNLLVTLEALIGLIGFAMATGLVFARFSRPTSRVIFSDVAVITKHDKVPSLMFRLANLRSSKIVEARVSVVFSRDEKTDEGEEYRMFYDLTLERDRTPIFIMTFTVVHPIDEKSPLRGLTYEDLRNSNAEIMVTLTGIDDSFAQPIHARFSYAPEEIIWNKNFADMILERPGSDVVIVDTDKISEIQA